jgi:hypothetical protein
VFSQLSVGHKPQSTQYVGKHREFKHRTEYEDQFYRK